VNKRGPIIIIEDSADDQHLLSEVFRRLNSGNEVLFFRNGELALDFLTKGNVYPFLILSDIFTAELGGFELRKKLYTNKQLQLRCVPYLFFTTKSTKEWAIRAYSESVQGFFVKPTNMDGLTKTIGSIIEYWTMCYAPDNDE
jgi:CheY-like chemotaxis protein